jgi:hypothetical protein
MTSPSTTRPLSRAYSHRDCEFNPPLWVSLQHDFHHIEVDVYCLLGQVFVAHDPHKIRPWKTLERLYLGPLQQHLRQHGKLFAKEKLYLFVDVKTPAHPSYQTLHTLLQRYQDIVTEFKKDDNKPVTIVISGNRLSYDDMQGQLGRYAVLDGRLKDLGTPPIPRSCPLSVIIGKNISVGKVKEICLKLNLKNFSASSTRPTSTIKKCVFGERPINQAKQERRFGHCCSSKVLTSSTLMT